jgi:AAA family ATP:ADP antiporter
MKYKAKQAVDTFFVRMGDVGSTLCVAVGANLLGYGVRAFALFDVVLVSLWIGLALAINKARRELEGEVPTVVGLGQHEREPDAVTAR